MSSPVATNALDYNGYVTQMGVMAIVNTQTVSGVVQGVDPPFTAIIPSMLNYAEDRIARDVALYSALTSLPYTLSVGNNTLSISVNDFVTVQTVGLTVNGQFTPLLPVSKEFIQNCYPSTATPAAPQYFAMVGGDQATGGNTSNNILVGPPPDNNYPVSVFGTIRMPSLFKFANAGQATGNYTFISTWLPELLIMASMLYITAFQRNFSATSDQAEMGVNYEQQYTALLRAVATEEARKRFEVSAWSSMPPAVAATPGR